MIMDNVLSVVSLRGSDRPTGRPISRGPDTTSYVMMRKRPITTRLLRAVAVRYINISACTNANDYVGTRAPTRDISYRVPVYIFIEGTGIESAPERDRIKGSLLMSVMYVMCIE